MGRQDEIISGILQLDRSGEQRTLEERSTILLGVIFRYGINLSFIQ